MPAALAWGMKTGRSVVLKIPVAVVADRLHKLPDHHNKYGEAWWLENDAKDWDCEWSCEESGTDFNETTREVRL